MLEFTLRETAARRRLESQGYLLHKGYQPVKGFGVGFMIVDAERNYVVSGSTNWPYDATFRDVEEFAAT